MTLEPPPEANVPLAAHAGGAVDWAARVSLWIGGTSVVAMAVLIVCDVVGRTFGRPLLMAGELSGYALVAVIFGGLAWADIGNRHVAITMAIDRLAPASRAKLDRVVLALTTLFVGWLAWFTFIPVGQDVALGTRSLAGSGLRIWIPEALIPLGLALLFVRLAIQLVFARSTRQVAGAVSNRL